MSLLLFFSFEQSNFFPRKHFRNFVSFRKSWKNLKPLEFDEIRSAFFVGSGFTVASMTVLTGTGSGVTTVSPKIPTISGPAWFEMKLVGKFCHLHDLDV